jgi:single-strand DNA-binding protein
MYINKVIIFGNLTRDPEVKALPTGIKVCSFSVATNRVWKDKEGKKQEATDYHNVVTFGRQAEVIAQYLRKGSSAYIEGRLQTRSWEDKSSGEKKYRTEIVADTFQFGPKSGGGSTGGGKSVTSDDVKEAPAAAIEYPEEEINPDDIPF